MGTYAELDKPEKLAGQMAFKEFNCADVARRINAEFGTRAEPQVVSRQMISKLKNGTARSCTPTLALRICWVLGISFDTLFVVRGLPNDGAHGAQKIPA